MIISPIINYNQMSILITNNMTVDLNSRLPYISAHVSLWVHHQSSNYLFWQMQTQERWPFLGKKGQNGESKMEDPIIKKQMQYGLQ